MMSVLVTYGQNPMSWIIRKLTKEPASHIAIRWDNWVLHSNLLGTHWSPYAKFIPTIIDEIPIENNPIKLLAFSAEHIAPFNYDYGGFLYCGLRLLLRNVGIRLPKKNLWQMTGMTMCHELGGSFVYGQEDTMLTPTQFGMRLRIPLKIDS